MYPRKQLDWSWALLFRGMYYLLFSNAKKARKNLESVWGKDALFLLSIRTGWDAFLNSVEWEEGSVVLMSAVTIPHMRDLVIEHGYKPVSIDLDIATLGVPEEALRLAIEKHQPKAFVFAHLLGSYTDLGSVKKICSQHDMLLIEDCAQAFHGFPLVDFSGDIAMFSFGTIKTCTALGGAVLYFRDPKIRKKIESQVSVYPQQNKSKYAKKLILSMAFLVLFPPHIFGILTTVNKDYETFLRKATRGFTGEGWLQKIRQAPHSTMLAMLSYRTKHYDSRYVNERERAGEIAQSVFENHGLKIVGSQATDRTHWLLCVQSEDPARAVSKCREIGFDFTQGASVMVALGGGNAEELMRSIVYLPCYGKLEERHYESIARCIKDLT